MSEHDAICAHLATAAQRTAGVEPSGPGCDECPASEREAFPGEAAPRHFDPP